LGVINPDLYLNESGLYARMGIFSPMALLTCHLPAPLLNNPNTRTNQAQCKSGYCITNAPWLENWFELARLLDLYLNGEFSKELLIELKFQLKKHWLTRNIIGIS
jgi:hypothetical protein